MLKKTLTVLLPIVFLTILTACGGAPKATVAIPSIDACALLTQADAEQILGGSVEAPTQPVQGAATFIVTSCEYYLQGGTPLDNASVIVSIPGDGDLSTAQSSYDQGKQQAQSLYNAAPVDVSGLGDAAYWVGGAGNNLFILAGNVNLTLSASTQKGDTPPQAIIDLAKVVIGRLP